MHWTRENTSCFGSNGNALYLDGVVSQVYTTVKIHHTLLLKYVLFIVNCSFIKPMPAKTETMVIRIDHSGLDDQARAYLLPVFTRKLLDKLSSDLKN